MKEKARKILLHAVGEVKPTNDLAEAMRARVASLSFVDLDIATREPMRELHAFDRA
jgi:hypothetical protein